MQIFLIELLLCQMVTLLATLWVWIFYSKLLN